MGLRTIISLFVVLFVSTKANTIQDGDGHYEHMLELIIGLQSTIINLESTVVNLEGVVCKQTTELEHLKEKVEKLEEMEGSCECSSETTTAVPATTLAPSTTVHNCREVFELGYIEDGVYNITVNDSPLQVYCQDGGWTVIQKRSDDSLNYNTSLDHYAEGFGSVESEHWLGLKHVHELTSTGNWTLRFDLGSFSGETAYAEYDDFRISSGPDFTMWYDRSSYRGTAGDSLEYDGGNPIISPFGRQFSTTDSKHDDCNDICATDFGGGGGWWYGCCSTALTTGMPYGERHAIHWISWKHYEVLKEATLKIMMRN